MIASQAESPLVTIDLQSLSFCAAHSIIITIIPLVNNLNLYAHYHLLHSSYLVFSIVIMIITVITITAISSNIIIIIHNNNNNNNNNNESPCLLLS